MSEEEISMDIDKKSIEELKKAINYDELEKRHQRFMNGTETEDDLINNIYHYKIQNNNGLNLDVVELKYYNKILDLYNKEKEKNEKLIQDNLDLKKLYERTAIKLRENGHIETAEFFEAQIDLCPVWTTWEEYTNWIHKDKIKEKLKKAEFHINNIDNDEGQAMYKILQELL